MATRDYAAEIRQVTAEITQLDTAARETMELEAQLEKDLVRFEGELAQPAVALNTVLFKKTNDAIEASYVKLSTARRSMGAISIARELLHGRRQNITNDQHLTEALEYGRSTLEVAHQLDEEVLPELKELVGHLLAFGNATAACMGQSGRRDAVFNPRVLLSLTFAQILRDAGLEVRVSEDIRTSRSNTDGYQTISDALAEFRSAIETTSVPASRS